MAAIQTVPRNKTTLAEKLMGDEVAAVVQAVIERPKDGEMTAARIIIDRLVRALAVETHENWLEAIHYLNMEHLKQHKKEALRTAACR